MWIGVYEPGKEKINRHLLFRIDPERKLIEVVRRRQKTVIDLRDYFDALWPKQGLGDGESTEVL